MEDLDIVGITKRSVQGIVALISRQFILQLISLAAFLVISTNLSAGEFGTYIIVITMQQIISFFTDFGLGAALIQKKGDLEQHEITTVFTIQCIVTALILVLVFIFRDVTKDVIAIFTSSSLTDDGVWLLIALIFTLFLSSFKLIPSILLERKIQFQKLIIPQIVESLTFNILLVILILRGYGLASYTYAFIISSLIGVPLYYFVCPWNIEFGITKSALVHLKFGTQFQAKNILANIKDKFLTLYLGATLGDVKVGYIGFAEKWAFFVYRFVVDSVTKVSFSTYARLQDEKEHLRKSLEKSLFFVSTIMFPVLLGVIITIPYFIEYIPKWHKWEPAMVSLIFFCLNAGVSSLSGILVNVLDANGKVKTTLRLMTIWTIMTWGLTLILIHYFDYNGVAIASFFVTLTIGYTVYLVKQVVPFHFWKSIIKPLLATSIMGVLVYLGTHVLVTNIITLFFVILMGGACYLATMYFLAGKQIIADIQAVFIKK